LCGYGRVKQNVAEDIREKAEEAGERILRGLQVKLAASQDPREAALGLYLLGST
jgi:hypothetical protein